MTSWHEEIEFIDMFNWVGEKLKELFPLINVVGNYEKPTIIE